MFVLMMIWACMRQPQPFEPVERNTILAAKKLAKTLPPFAHQHSGVSQRDVVAIPHGFVQPGAQLDWSHSKRNLGRPFLRQWGTMEPRLLARSARNSCE